MRRTEFSFTPIDREHELQGERDEAFDNAMNIEVARQVKAIRGNAITGHEQTLVLLGETLTERLTGKGVSEHLIRAALTCGPLTAGNMLLDLVGKCIDDHADAGATVEMSGAGMDLRAMRAVAPAYVRVPA